MCLCFERKSRTACVMKIKTQNCLCYEIFSLPPLPHRVTAGSGGAAAARAACARRQAVAGQQAAAHSSRHGGGGAACSLHGGGGACARVGRRGAMKRQLRSALSCFYSTSEALYAGQFVLTAATSGC